MNRDDFEKVAAGEFVLARRKETGAEGAGNSSFWSHFEAHMKSAMAAYDRLHGDVHKDPNKAWTDDGRRKILEGLPHVPKDGP